MNTITIKSDLQKVISNLILKTKLTNRAKQSEEDIVAGRVFTKDEIIEQTNLIGK